MATELLARIASRLGFGDARDAKGVLEAVSAAIVDELRDGSGVVDLPGFARLAYRRDPPVRTRNPFTGAVLEVPGVGRLKVRLIAELAGSTSPRSVDE